LVAIDVDITGAVPPDDVIGDVAVTPVTVPPLEGLEFVIVKFGYVPVTDIPAPLLSTTVWSGAVLAMVKLGYVPVTFMPVPLLNTTVWSGAEFVILIVGLMFGFPVTDAVIPVPELTATDVTVPVPVGAGLTNTFPVLSTFNIPTDVSPDENAVELLYRLSCN
jgi:hypothetical protein